LKQPPKTKLYLVSNMYPSKENVRYGVFVKNFEITIEDHFDVHRIVLTKKYRFHTKVLGYILLYLKIIQLFFKPKDVIIYVHYPLFLTPVLLLISMVKKNMILNFHGTDLIFDTLFKKVLAVFQKQLIPTSRIVVPSNYYKEKVLDSYQSDEERILVYPSGGINTAVFYPDTVQKQKGFTIGYISNFIKEKGWLTFLEAMVSIHENKLIPRLNLIMIGDGPDEAKIKAFVSKHKLPVIFSSKLTQTELAKKYNLLDLFIFPTHSESLGLVGLEAMACGVPIIAAKAGGPMSYVEDEINGYLFDIKDATMLVERIVTFYSLSDKEKTMFSENALNTAQAYHHLKVKKELLIFLGN
jgi:glycosyltransferase involved in cell wall biosynthesis